MCLSGISRLSYDGNEGLAYSRIERLVYSGIIRFSYSGIGQPLPEYEPEWSSIMESSLIVSFSYSLCGSNTYFAKPSNSQIQIR